MSWSRIAAFTGTTSCALSGLTSGDLLVAAGSHYSANAIDFPAGWTRVYNLLDEVGGAGEQFGAGFGYKVSDGTETTFAPTGAYRVLVGQFRSTLGYSGDFTSSGNFANCIAATTVTSINTGTTGSQVQSVNLAVAMWAIDNSSSWDAGRTFTNGSNEVYSNFCNQVWFAHNSTAGTYDNCDWSGDTADQACGVIFVFGESTGGGGGAYAPVLGSALLRSVIHRGIIR